MRKLYVLNFDSTDGRADSIHNAVKTSSLITNWSHYLPDSYIIQSEVGAKELSLSLRDFIGGDFRHYIFRLDKNYHGYMPKKQWEWLKARQDWWE